MSSEKKRYLGDAVYAEFDGFSIILTTDNGLGADNTIVLDPEVLKALNDFVESIKREPRRAKSKLP